MIILLVGYCILAAITLRIAVRNMAVYRHSRMLLKLIHECCLDDIYNERSWRWRYEEFDKVNYSIMVYKFWKPLASFWANYAFIDPTATDPALKKN